MVAGLAFRSAFLHSCLGRRWRFLYEMLCWANIIIGREHNNSTDVVVVSYINSLFMKLLCTVNQDYMRR